MTTPMKRTRFVHVEDYLALVIRKKWWVILPFIALSTLLSLLATMMPRVYVSESMLQIEPRDVPTEFVKDLIGGTQDQRLTALEKLILSRTNLLKILKEFENGMPSYRRLNDERKVLRLRNQIKIDFLSEKIAGRNMPVANVRIAYRDPDPDQAQRVTERLTTLFIEQESRNRENLVSGTAEFLTAELGKIAAQLKQSEDSLKALKEKYRYELPDQLDTNLRTLDRLQMQMTSNMEALDRHMTMQLNLEKQLAETPTMITRESAAAINRVIQEKPANPKLAAYNKKEQEYREMLTKLTPKHPDVQRLKTELDQLKSEIPPEELQPEEKVSTETTLPPMVPNPIYQNIAAQLRQVKTEIEIRQREKKQIESEIARFNQRVQNTPRTEQEMAAIVRSNADLMKQHEDLKIKLTQAQLAESLESRNKGSQFVLIDPAFRPLEPATPSTRTMILACVLLSLGASLGLAFLVGFLDQRIWTQPELERFLGAPVLIEIPKMQDRADLRKAMRLRIAFALSIAVGFSLYAVCLYYIYLHQSAVVQLLDPLFERIISRYA